MTCDVFSCGGEAETKAIRKKVIDLIGKIPPPLQEAPRAVLDRNIATPTLFICHGILFENFITNEDEEERFSKSVVFPAFR